MKTLYLAIIIIAIVSLFSTVLPIEAQCYGCGQNSSALKQALLEKQLGLTGSPNINAEITSGQVLFMKSNSIGKIYANFTFHILDNQTRNLNPEIHTSLYDSNSITSDNLSIIATPRSIIANKSNVDVTYTITAKNDVKGVYALFLYFCGQTPLAIGLNESEVNPAVFNQFFTAVNYCPAGGESTPEMNIIGYSGIISKNIYTNSSNTNNANLVNQLGEIPSSPLKQFRTGIKLSDIKCKEDFMLITKHEDNSPACVTSNTAIALTERGWTIDLQIHKP